MAEFLVRINDKISEDPYADSKLLKRGDVVAIQRNGWSWGLAELNNPDWRILKFPDVSIDVASIFLTKELDTDLSNPSYVLRKRAFAINIDNPIFKNLLEDSTSNNTFMLSEQEILGLKINKDSLKDPDILD